MGKIIRNIGALLVMIAVPGCMVCASVQDGSTGVGWMTGALFLGLVLFVAGRMAE